MRKRIAVYTLLKRDAFLSIDLARFTLRHRNNHEEILIPIMLHFGVSSFLDIIWSC